MVGGYLRHGTGHTDERVDRTKADADPPQVCRPDDPLAELLVASGKAEHGARPTRKAVVNLLPWMPR